MHDDERGPMGGLSDAIRAVAGSVSPLGAAPGHDAAGGSVGSLTEAIMGITAGLVKIADALESVAEAIRENRENDG